MNDATQLIRRQLAAIGHVSRFRIVLALCERERHVSDLAEALGLSQSCTTRHLQVLEGAQVIHTRRSGKRVLAALALEVPEVAQVVAWLRAAGGVGAYPASGASTIAAAAPSASRSRPLPADGDTGRGPRFQELTHAGARTSATPPAAETLPTPSSSSRSSDLDDFLL
jgi:DNA-binding transcriptional ArsR family regulator